MQKILPNEDIVAQLVAMGFNYLHCQKAAINTSNAGVEEAMNWLLSHMDDPGVLLSFFLSVSAESKFIYKGMLAMRRFFKNSFFSYQILTLRFHKVVEEMRFLLISQRLKLYFPLDFQKNLLGKH